ncbi:MAG: NAD(P)H-dependent oxidoreductase subunit E [Planctomycetes bacterium]|nr:NAD(P)H-dependent oxidoreductase subunit E [Planctomycetota bacterium]
MEHTTLVDEAINEHGIKRENLLPILQSIVSKKSFVTQEDMAIIAERLELSEAEVYGTATFYSFLDIEERGENIIRICKTLICSMQNKETIIEAIENHLHIKLGEKTPDNKFSLLETNCLGFCHKGPAMLVNDDVYTEVTPEKAVEIINKYK